MSRSKSIGSVNSAYLEEASEHGAEALVPASVLEALDATDVLDLDLRDLKESPRFITPLPGTEAFATIFHVHNKVTNNTQQAMDMVLSEKFTK